MPLVLTLPLPVTFRAPVTLALPVTFKDPETLALPLIEAIPVTARVLDSGIVTVDPVLDLGMRLGEGSGAALVWPLLVSACAVMRDMASFESAGVSREQENISIGSPG